MRITRWCSCRWNDFFYWTAAFCSIISVWTLTLISCVRGSIGRAEAGTASVPGCDRPWDSRTWVPRGERPWDSRTCVRRPALKNWIKLEPSTKFLCESSIGKCDPNDVVPNIKNQDLYDADFNAEHYLNPSSDWDYWFNPFWIYPRFWIFGG